MGIIVISQTLNEERNIEAFCEGYSFADKILIVDGGSQDRTREIAARFDKTEIIDGSHLNTNHISKQGPQINLGIKRAKELKAKWIIVDDCDSWPNSHLKKAAQAILENATVPTVFAYHLYIWGSKEYFPKMNEPGPGLWAWQPEKIDIYASGEFVTDLKNVPKEGLKLDFPLALLHYFAPDEETVQRKRTQKEARGSSWVHPLETIYAPPEPLPEWALGC